MNVGDVNGQVCQLSRSTAQRNHCSQGEACICRGWYRFNILIGEKFAISRVSEASAVFVVQTDTLAHPIFKAVRCI
jgi:hypothetical protein